MLMTISEGRSFVLFGDAGIVEEMFVWVVDARRGVGRDVNGMGIFCSSEKERVLCGSGGVGVDNVDSRVFWGGEDEEMIGGEREDVLRWGRDVFVVVEGMDESGMMGTGIICIKDVIDRSIKMIWSAMRLLNKTPVPNERLHAQPRNLTYTSAFSFRTSDFMSVR